MQNLPYDIAAEKRLLSSIVSMPDESLLRLSECEVQGITERSFFDANNQILWSAIHAVGSNGKNIELYSIYEKLKELGKLETIGGVQAISGMASLSCSIFLEENVKSVRQLELRRNLMRVTDTATIMASELKYDVDGVVSYIDAEVQKIGETSVGDTTQTMEQVAKANEEELGCLINGVSVKEGLITGFPTLDRFTNGLQPKTMVVVAARPSVGKAQPLSAKILTPKGFKAMGDIVVGDKVIGSDGLSHNVLGVYPQGAKSIYRVNFSDKSSTRCCIEHLWFTQTRNERRRGLSGSVKQLADIIKTVKRGDGGQRNHAIPVCAPVEFEQADELPLKPYLLGALIGDGSLAKSCACFHKPEQDVIDKVLLNLPDGDTATAIHGGIRIIKKGGGMATSKTKQALVSLGLDVSSEDKFIPLQYKVASIHNRIELLRGLLDTDGYTIGSSFEYSSSSLRLFNDVVDLARSLGGIVAVGESRIPTYTYLGEKKQGLRSYRCNIWFRSGIVPVSSQKHLKKFKAVKETYHRSIVEVIEDGFEECQCIMVDAPNHLYITDDYIPTHNTSLVMNIAERIITKETNKSILFFSLEMDSLAIIKKLICSMSGVSMGRMADGFITTNQREEVKKAKETIEKSNFWINENSDLTISKMRAIARQKNRRKKLDLIIIDYIQFIQPNDLKANKETQTSEISRNIKAMAKEIGCPVIALSQLSRDSDKGERRPKLSDLRDSGAIEQDADVVTFLWPNRDTGLVELLIAKNRTGMTGVCELQFKPEITKFVEVKK